MLVILVLQRLKQEDRVFQVNLSHTKTFYPPLVTEIEVYNRLVYLFNLSSVILCLWKMRSVCKMVQWRT